MQMDTEPEKRLHRYYNQAHNGEESKTVLSCCVEVHRQSSFMRQDFDCKGQSFRSFPKKLPEGEEMAGLPLWIFNTNPAQALVEKPYICVHLPVWIWRDVPASKELVLRVLDPRDNYWSIVATTTSRIADHPYMELHLDKLDGRMLLVPVTRPPTANTTVKGDDMTTLTVHDHPRIILSIPPHSMSDGATAELQIRAIDDDALKKMQEQNHELHDIKALAPVVKVTLNDNSITKPVRVLIQNPQTNENDDTFYVTLMEGNCSSVEVSKSKEVHVEIKGPGETKVLSLQTKRNKSKEDVEKLAKSITDDLGKYLINFFVCQKCSNHKFVCFDSARIHATPHRVQELKAYGYGDGVMPSQDVFAVEGQVFKLLFEGNVNFVDREILEVEFHPNMNTTRREFEVKVVDHSSQDEKDTFTGKALVKTTNGEDTSYVYECPIDIEKQQQIPASTMNTIYDRTGENDSPNVQRLFRKTALRIAVKVVEDDDSGAALRDWETLGRVLGLSEAALTIINHDHHHRMKDCLHATLSKWQQQAGDQASSDALLRALKEINLNKIAGDVQGKLAQ